MRFDTMGDRREFRAAGRSSVRLDVAQPEEMSHTLGMLADPRLAAVHRLRLEPERLAPRQPQSELVRRIAVAVPRLHDLHGARVAERELGPPAPARPQPA